MLRVLVGSLVFNDTDDLKGLGLRLPAEGYRVGVIAYLNTLNRNVVSVA